MVFAINGEILGQELVRATIKLVKGKFYSQMWTINSI